MKGKKKEKPTEPKELAAANEFHKWLNGNTVSFLSSEYMVYSKKYSYAGTLDWTANVNGRTILGDLKTSSGISGEMGYQLALYRQAFVEEHGSDPFQGEVIVNCRKDGTLEVREFTEYKQDLKAALACIPLFRRQKELEAKEKK